MSDLVGIPEDRFSRVAAYVYLLLNDDVSTVYLNLVIKIITKNFPNRSDTYQRRIVHTCN